MRILLAPDKFKGTFSAAGVCDLLAAGISEVLPDAQVRSIAVADGGDGTLDAVLGAGFDEVPVVAAGPLGVPRPARYARRGDVAVVELATICGLEVLTEESGPPTSATAWAASSRGLGEVIAAAMDAGVRRVVVGIGGSASTDGGAGMLAALGARILQANGSPVPDGAAGLAEAATVDLSELRVPPSLVIACDVDNPLTGPRGAAAVYAPQKGATEDDVPQLDAALTHWASLVERSRNPRSPVERSRNPPSLVERSRNQPGAGAAGGVGFAALTALSATMRPGAQVVFELTGFAEALAECDLVITGEGSLDTQTLHGKAPALVAAAADAAGKRVLAVAGVCRLSPEELRGSGVERVYALVDGELPSDSPESLMAVGRQIGRDLRQASSEATLP